MELENEFRIIVLSLVRMAERLPKLANKSLVLCAVGLEMHMSKSACSSILASN